MKRFILPLMLIMFFVCTGILFFQWNGFSKGSAEETTIKEVDHLFKIIHEGQNFYVTQTIHFNSDHLNPIKINWPKNSTDYKCKMKDGENCLTKENGDFFIKKGKENSREVTITYILKKPKTTDYLLLNNWYPTFSSLSSKSTKIAITEKNLRNGQWISGYEDSSSKKLDFIDYYAFTGQGTISDLIWLQQSVSKEDFSNYRMYSKIPLDVNSKDLGSNEMNGFVTLILDDNIKPFQSEHLLIYNSINDKQEIMNDINWSLLQQTYSTTDKNGWMKELAASISLKKPIGTNKTHYIYRQLEEGLTKEQFDHFKKILDTKKNRVVDETELDTILHGITGFSSSFFSENSANVDGRPLILKSDKPLQYGGKTIPHSSYILYQQKELISFKEAIEAMGFEVKQIQKDIFFVSMDGNTLRFYLNQDYFIYNEENYGLLTKPVKTVGNTIYMDASWFEKLFTVKIDKEANRIQLKKVK